MITFPKTKAISSLILSKIKCKAINRLLHRSIHRRFTVQLFKCASKGVGTSKKLAPLIKEFSKAFDFELFSCNFQHQQQQERTICKLMEKEDEAARREISPEVAWKTEREKCSVVAFVVVVYRPAPVVFTRLRISGDVDFVQTTHVSWFLLCRHRNGNQVATTNDTFWREDSSILLSSLFAVHGWGWSV